MTSPSYLAKKVAARFLSTTDPKKAVSALLKKAERDLIAFVAKLPGKVRVGTTVETPPPRGGYGPYVVGTISMVTTSVYRATVTFDMSNQTVAIGAAHNNFVFDRAATRGTLRDAPQRLQKALSILKESLTRDLAREVSSQPKEVEDADKGAWSVVSMREGYASDVQVFSSKERAESEARDLGERYVVKGTQMWNEPLGQVEEHSRIAPSKYFR